MSSAHSLVKVAVQRPTEGSVDGMGAGHQEMPADQKAGADRCTVVGRLSPPHDGARMRASAAAALPTLLSAFIASCGSPTAYRSVLAGWIGRLLIGRQDRWVLPYQLELDVGIAVGGGEEGADLHGKADADFHLDLFRGVEALQCFEHGIGRRSYLGDTGPNHLRTPLIATAGKVEFGVTGTADADIGGFDPDLLAIGEFEALQIGLISHGTSR
jgi:hypothetical protein